MSWAKHDIEGWQKIEVDGVLARFSLNTPKPAPDWITRDRLEYLQEMQPTFWAELVGWAHAEIVEAEADREAGLIDAATDAAADREIQS